METVLVLEDDPTNLKVMALALRLDGYLVLEASDGNAAIQICNELRDPIQLLVADVQLPDILGTEVALNLLKFWPKIAILFTSGTPVSHWAPAALAGLDHVSNAAVVGILEKPFSPRSLEKTIRQLLVRRDRKKEALLRDVGHIHGGGHG